MDPRLRASDADRERTVAALRAHVADGRITLDEFSERCATAYAARTLGDLAAIAADLPPVPRSVEPANRWSAGRWMPWVLGAAVASTLVGVGMLGGVAEAVAAAGPMMDGMCR